MKLKPAIFGLCAVLALLAAHMARCDAALIYPTSTLEIDTADGAHHEFSIEVARTDPQMEHGLMFRRELAPDAGMLFVYPSPREITMWMKNTYLPLDMVFMDAKGTVTHIAPDAAPESTDTISSGAPALAVLEINAGVAARLGIAPGDRVISPALHP